MVAGDHMTDPTDYITYLSIISRDYVRIAFVIADLNWLDILVEDIGNSYINDHCSKTVYFTARAEFDNQKYANVIVVHVLYRIKYITAACRAYWYEIMRDMNVVPLEDNSNVWMQKATM